MGLGGEVEHDTGEAGGGEAAGDGGACGFWGIAFCGEVCEEDVGEGISGDIEEEVSGEVIGEVAHTAGDSLFEVPGAAGHLEHILVVVGFEDEGTATLEVVSDEFGGHTEVGTDTEAGVGGFDDIADGGAGVVGEWESEDLEGADREGGTFGEGGPGEGAVGVVQGLDGSEVGEEADIGELLMEGTDAADVVGMFVGEANGGDIIWVEAGGVHTAEEVTFWEAVIDEDGGMIGGDVDCVTAAAGSQYAEFKHGERLFG